MRPFVLALAALSITSCHRGPEPFSTRAVYRANRSRARFAVFAIGSMRNDKSSLMIPVTTHVIACSTTKGGTPFRFDVLEDQTVATPQGTASWKPADRIGVLTHMLEAAHFSPPDAAELTELAEAIDGVATGPASTRIAGQMHQLVVDSVDFHTALAPTLDDCSR